MPPRHSTHPTAQAVANSIGSNIFDILFGLGLPFLLSATVAHPGIKDKSGVSAVPVATDASRRLGPPHRTPPTLARPRLALTLPAAPAATFTQDLAFSMACLFGVVVFLLAALMLTKWRLVKAVGLFFIFLYACFVVAALLI